MKATCSKTLIGLLNVFKSYSIAIIKDPVTGDPNFVAQQVIAGEGENDSLTLAIAIALQGEAPPTPVIVDHAKLQQAVLAGTDVTMDCATPNMEALAAAQVVPNITLPETTPTIAEGVLYDPESMALSMMTPPHLLSLDPSLVSTMTLFINPNADLKNIADLITHMKILPPSADVDAESLHKQLTQQNNTGNTTMAGSSRARNNTKAATATTTTETEVAPNTATPAPAVEPNTTMPTTVDVEATSNVDEPPFDVDTPETESPTEPTAVGTGDTAYSADRPRPKRQSLSENQIAGVYKKPYYALIDFSHFFPEGTDAKQIESMIYDHLAMVCGVELEAPEEPTVEEMSAQVVELMGKIALQASGPQVDVAAIKLEAVEEYKAKAAAAIQNL